MKSLLYKLATFISERFNIRIENIFKYAHNTSWLLLDYIFSLAVGFIVMILVARYLGPSSYGIISFALVLYAIALDFMTLGIDDLVVRQALKNINRGEEGRVPSIFATALFARNLAMVYILTIALIYTFFAFDKNDAFVVAVVLSALLIRPLDILNLFFQMKVEMKYASISKMVGYFTSAVAKVLLIILQMPVIYFAFAILLESIFAISFLLFFYFKRGNSFLGWKIDFSILKYYIKNGWALFFTKLFSILHLKANIFFIQYLMFSKDIGIYSSAFRIVEILFLLPNIIGNSIFPAIVGAYQKGGQTFNLRIGQLLVLVMWVFIALALIVTFSSNFIIHLIFGEAYIQASSLLRVLIWAVPLYMLNVITTKYLLVDNNMVSCMVRSVISLILIVFFNLIFFDSFGILGFTYSLILSFLITYFFLDILSSKSRELFFIKCKSIFAPFLFFMLKK